jgi:hypothetical protein
MPDGRGKRGRPPKFGRPSQVVALTLPDEVVRGLRRVHPDLAWAVVTLFEKEPRRLSASAQDRVQPDVELVTIAERQSLIVVNRSVFKRLPGIQIVPLDGRRAFLALEPGRGMADLELAVLDRIEDAAVAPPERQALARLRTELRTWRHDRTLRFHIKAIIVAERLSVRRQS